MLEAVYKLLNLSVDETSRALQLLKKMDKNADGSVDQEEFIEACMNNQKLMENLRYPNQDQWFII